ncbi:BtpA/SgcQ family protein [Paenibacillus sp. IB182496]|uniref:BtpA/SgcQ family protein n=1 Tax=Paenibacillus sabuli TaxID=2772509 RepID=A0A927BR10_9BACL|nr:BtpA/SgcQ family protein [Paenibacillus sabuli]MBD2844341.1 BtpA/SgcQ family protein [Paenibacillus sabuli]
MTWLKEIIGTEKAIIAMCHLQPLPGDPHYDADKGMAYVLEAARADLLALQRGGVDAVMFSNEFSLPYLTDVRTETVAAMARIIGELMGEIRVPFGVNVLWDAKKSLDLAAATGASFVREIFSGVYASDFGLWNTNVGETIRHQRQIGASHVKLLYNIVPEAAQYLADRDIESVARSTVFNNRPDALCVSGLIAGAETDGQLLKRVKAQVPDTVVLANTGMRIDNIERQLSVADGAVVGTTFKVDGRFENAVDEARVRAFMDKVKAFRAQAEPTGVKAAVKLS